MTNPTDLDALREELEQLKHGLETMMKMAVFQIDENSDFQKFFERSVDQLQRTLSAMPRWIPVSERLPEPDTLVLVIDQSMARMDIHEMKNGYGPKRAIAGLRFGRLFSGSKEFRVDGTNGKCEISHWMPLPTPPAEGR